METNTKHDRFSFSKLERETLLSAVDLGIIDALDLAEILTEFEWCFDRACDAIHEAAYSDRHTLEGQARRAEWVTIRDANHSASQALKPTPKKLSAAESTRLLKRMLKAEFPETKFSVRMSRGTAYGSVTIYWIDGPDDDDVRAISRQFQGKSFDGMTDSTSYRKTVVGFEGQHFEPCLGYVFESRKHSEERIQEKIQRLKAEGYTETFRNSLRQAAEMLLSRPEDSIPYVANQCHLKRS